jgi:membrane protein
MPEAPTFVASTRARVEAWVQRGRATILGRVWERLLEVTFVETSIALAAKAFVALFPLLIIIASVAPDAVRLAIVSALRNRMGLDASTTDVVTGAFQSPENVRRATSVVSLIFLFFYATTFTTALQRVYLRAWRRPRRGGITNQGRGLMWIVGVAVGIALLGGLRRVVAGGPASVAAAIIVVGSSVALWWWTAWVLLRGDVRWRVLLPGAVLTAAGMLTYALSAQVWMPRTVRENSAQFGFFGVALALVTWFTGVAFIIVGAATINAVLAEDQGVLGRLTRGRRNEVLRPDAPEPLPAPLIGPRLRDALLPGSDEP